VLEAAKKAGSAGELLSKRDLQTIFQQALNPPKEQAAKVRGVQADRSMVSGSCLVACAGSTSKGQRGLSLCSGTARREEVFSEGLD
jgi:hypothetical protein